jgi:hypothetical protein
MRPSSEQLLSADLAADAALKQCSIACKGVVAFYLSDDEAAHNEFGRCLLRAAAAIDAAAAALDTEDPDERRSTFAIVAPICHAAAAECRRSGFDLRLLKVAASCERAAAICESRS